MRHRLSDADPARVRRFRPAAGSIITVVPRLLIRNPAIPSQRRVVPSPVSKASTPNAWVARARARAWCRDRTEPDAGWVRSPQRIFLKGCRRLLKARLCRRRRRMTCGRVGRGRPGASPFFSPPSHFPRRLAGVHLASDETIALTAGADPAAKTSTYWLSGLSFFAVWATSTLAGALIGGAIGDPETLGLDAAFPAVFVSTHASPRSPHSPDYHSPSSSPSPSLPPRSPGSSANYVR